MPLWQAIAYLLVGFVLLAYGAHCFVKASVSLGQLLKLSPLVIGVLFVGFGGSFPEIVVSLVAALKGQTHLAVGNAIGSNIVNIGVVLGLTACVVPMTVHRHCFRRDFPILALTMALVFSMIWDSYLSRPDGVLLLGLLIVYVWTVVWLAKRSPSEVDVEMPEEEGANRPSALKAGLLWFFGLALLFVSSELLVSGATSIATRLGVSSLLIGLTVVAIGTSLPEFATTMVSAIRGQHDIAVGNVVGSNVFNLLGVLAMPALLHPAAISREVLWRDFPVMVILTLAVWLLAWLPKRYVIGRYNGALLLLGYLVYLAVLIAGR
jgi:cation:H+ antiporter